MVCVVDTNVIVWVGGMLGLFLMICCVSDSFELLLCICL